MPTALALVVVLANAASAGVSRSSDRLDPPDPYYPSLGNDGYDVRHYRLDLEVELPNPEVRGDTRLEATAAQRLTVLYLDLTGLEVQSVHVDGRRARFSRRGGELAVRPRHPIASGADFVVRVRYFGVPGTGVIPGIGAPNGWIADRRGVTTLDEPDGASRWFPSNDHPRDKATYTYRVRVPKHLEVIANGRLDRREAHGDFTTWVWKETAPMAPYLTQLVIGDLQLVESDPVDGVALRSAYAPGVERAASAAVAQTPDMLRYFTTLFGPFPFDVYGIVVPESGLVGLAFEAQTISVFAPDVLADPETASVILAHELSHQWFGDWVSPESWSDVWLNEGFATYAEWLWSEHALDIPVDANADQARRHVTSDMDTAVDDPGLDAMFGIATYERGALVLHALRREVGDDAFFAILRKYLERFGGSVASTRDFIEVTGEVAGRDLEPLLRAWLGPGPVPTLSGS